MSHRFAEEMAEGLALWADYISADLRGIAWSIAREMNPKRFVGMVALMALAYVGAVGWALAF